MNDKTNPELVDNLRATERSVLENLRGPAWVFLKKVKDFVFGDAQPVIRIRTGTRTTPAGPTTQAPIVVWGSGGFELSACVAEEQEALSIPLEVDHGHYYSSGKIADPASLGLHSRSFSISLPFQRRKAIAAGADEVYLGHPAAKAHLKINSKTFSLELEVSGTGAKIRVGAGATRGAARFDDNVTSSAAFNTWQSTISTAAGVTPMAGTLIGKISTASEKTDIE